MGRYVTPRNGRERGSGGGGRKLDKEPCLCIFGHLYFPFKRGENVLRAPLDLILH